MPGENDDLFKAMQMFKEGVSEYQTTQAVNDARSQLSQLHFDEKKQGEYQQQASAIGNDLALRLTAAHASPQIIAQATNGLAPSANVTETNFAQSQMQMQGEKSKESLQAKELKNKLDIEQMKVDAILGKDRNKEKNAVAKLGKEFGDQKQIKPLLESLNKLNDAYDSIDSAQGQMGATMAVNMARLGVIKSFAGRVNEKEIQMADESPGIRAKMWKEAGLQATGEVPQNVQEFWKSYIGAAKVNAYKRLQAERKGFARSKVIANPAMDEDQINQVIAAQYESSAPAAVGTRAVKSRIYYPKVDKTLMQYSDGTEEALDGKH